MRHVIGAFCITWMQKAPEGPLQRICIGAPGFEPGTSPTRTVRATRLRHAPRRGRLSQRSTWEDAPSRCGATLGLGRGLRLEEMVRKVAVLVALMALAVVPAPARAYLPPGFIGISPQKPSTARDFDLMAGAGIDSGRLPMYWTGIQPRDPAFAKPNWSGFDTEVELAAQAGIRVMPFVWSAPPWVAPETVDLPVRTSWQKRAWARFLAEA